MAKPPRADDDETIHVIVEWTKSNGFPPSMREIATEVGRSVNWVHGSVVRLQAAGRLKRNPNSPRSMVVLPPPDSKG